MLIDLGLRRTTARNTALAAGLLILGLPVSGPVQSRIEQGHICPGADLARYTSQSHATEKGVRRRCELLKRIESDGELEPVSLRDRVRHELSNRFAVEIDFSGRIGLPRRVVDFLLGHMPETAVMVSAYSDSDYTATQTGAIHGPAMFFVTDNDTFAASFTYLFSRPSTDTSEHMFFESGFAKVLFWKIWGNSFIHYRLRQDGESTSRYDIKVHVFTDSRLLRLVLKSGPFRYYSRSMFKGVLNDIESAVRGFDADSNRGETLPEYYVAGLKSRLQANTRIQFLEQRSSGR